MDDFLIFSGTAIPDLASAIARELGVRPGLCAVERFPDGEVSVKLEESVRRKEVYIIQSTSPPVNDHLVELLAFADAFRRASAQSITAIIPYFGYSRSDKRHGRREAIAASMVADLLQAVNIDHIITIDLHTPQIEGFFQIPVDNLSAAPTLCGSVRGRLPEDAVVVSPDAGRVKMATEFANRLGLPLVVLHKRRDSGTDTTVTHLVGDVGERACLIVDDIISTGGTIVRSIEALLDAGAREEIYVASTHGLLLGGAPEMLDCKAVREVYITDTITAVEPRAPKLKVISVAPLIAGAINQLMADGWLGDLY
jgi:ribose-phosphate pyrophosphokinase